LKGLLTKETGQAILTGSVVSTGRVVYNIYNKTLG